MRVPFGPREPNTSERELLEKLGFDLDKIELTGRYHFLDIPESPRFRCERNTPDFDKVSYEIYYNDVNVISINQKTAIYDAYVYFHISASAVEAALAKNAEITEAEEAAKSAPLVLTPYQKRLAECLAQLVNIIFEGGARAGYGSWIGRRLEQLKTLQRENPVEHDALIASKERYQELLAMFPSWVDSNYLQAKYERMDAGPFRAMGAINADGTRPDCSIM